MRTSPGDRWVCVQHEAFEGPGLIGEVARERGVALEVRRMDLGEPLPAARDLAGLIVMGGTASVYDGSSFRTRDAELDLIVSMLGDEKPVLGVCLGAQLMAAALGARVYGGPVKEIGLGTVRLTEAGAADRVLGPSGAEIRCMHWHGDTFDLPARAVHLASSEVYPHQAFRAGRLGYALQFHVEVDADLAAAWQRHLPAGIGVDAGARAELEREGRRIIGRFFDAAAAPGTHP